MTLRKVNGKAMVTPRPETEEYNVQNFVYVRRRPFHPRRLYDLVYDKFILQSEPEDEDMGMATQAELGDVDSEDQDMDSEGQDIGDNDAFEDEDMVDEKSSEDDNHHSDAPALPDNATILANKKQSPLFARLFRSKGEIWLATRPNRAGEWSQAGAMLAMVGGRPWFAVTAKEEWQTGDNEIDAMIQIDMVDGGIYGDRRQEVVFIGELLDVAGLEQALDRCLLTDVEWDKWQAVMAAGDGPNDCSQHCVAQKQEQLYELFEDGFPNWAEEEHGENGDHNHDH
ncbi:hypothetical protein LTS10_011269 [Elasticomyces elasticus]|nr:hypothetical protein LTS10_011269 [Elasticomyces elasticus]